MLRSGARYGALLDITCMSQSPKFGGLGVGPFFTLAMASKKLESQTWRTYLLTSAAGVEAVAGQLGDRSTRAMTDRPRQKNKCS